MKPDIQTLSDFGIVLYGQQWQTPLANALGISDRQMRNWVAGAQSINPRIWRKLPEIAAAHAAEYRQKARLVENFGTRYAKEMAKPYFQKCLESAQS